MFDEHPILTETELPLHLEDESRTHRLFTEDIDSRSLTELLMAERPQANRRSGHCIILYLPQKREPLEFWNQTEISMGRSDKRHNFKPHLDLTAQHAAQLGVSRKHAKIFYQNGVYYIQDLNSTNGTWVNNKKLNPQEAVALMDGDSLRLGHLIIQVGGCQRQ